MIDDEEKQRYVKATSCEDCLGWHKYCNAECCRSIYLNIKISELDKGSRYVTLNPGKRLGLSDIQYYRFHDVEYIRGLLRFKKDRIVVIGRKVMYIHNCSRLDGNMCLNHPDKKPELCNVLTLDTAKLPGQPFKTTSNCLFKYKCKEVK